MDEKTLEQELEKAKELLKFKAGETVNLRMNDKKEYEGTFLGKDDHCLYLKEVNISTDLTQRKYVRIWISHINARTYQ